jgi:uncharacterized protein YijF (DUF1287 family)
LFSALAHGDGNFFNLIVSFEIVSKRMANCWIEACTRGQELREAKRKANEERPSGWRADRPDLEPPKRDTFNLEEIFGKNNKKFLESVDQDTYENFVTLWD